MIKESKLNQEESELKKNSPEAGQTIEMGPDQTMADEPSVESQESPESESGKNWDIPKMFAFLDLKENDNIAVTDQIAEKLYEYTAPDAPKPKSDKEQRHLDNIISIYESLGVDPGGRYTTLESLKNTLANFNQKKVEESKMVLRQASEARKFLEVGPEDVSREEIKDAFLYLRNKYSIKNKKNLSPEDLQHFNEIRSFIKNMRGITGENTATVDAIKKILDEEKSLRETQKTISSENQTVGQIPKAPVQKIEVTEGVTESDAPISDPSLKEVEDYLNKGRGVKKTEGEITPEKNFLITLSEINQAAKAEVEKNPDVLKNNLGSILEYAEVPYGELTRKELEENSKEDAKEYFEGKKQTVYESKKALGERMRELYRGISEIKVKKKKSEQDQKDIKLHAYIEKAWEKLSDEEKNSFSQEKGGKTHDKYAKFNFVASLARERFKNIQLNCKKNIVDKTVKSFTGEKSTLELTLSDAEKKELERQDKRFKGLRVSIDVASGKKSTQSLDETQISISKEREKISKIMATSENNMENKLELGRRLEVLAREIEKESNQKRYFELLEQKRRILNELRKIETPQENIERRKSILQKTANGEKKGKPIEAAEKEEISERDINRKYQAIGFLGKLKIEAIDLWDDLKKSFRGSKSKK